MCWLILANKMARILITLKDRQEAALSAFTGAAYRSH
jgi:hypothetical protein